jgi:outer membrane protein OmpA-like peptidoglycan-associated protein
MDIFMTTRLSEDDWTQWSEPINLGKEINYTGDDCWYKISTDGKIAYFSKSTNENDKIMWLNLPERLRPNPVATISGQLCDKKGKAVSTLIRWEDLEENITVGQSQTDPVDGSFFIVLPMGKNYGYYINNDDYFPLANSIDLRGKNENIILEKKLEVASIKQMIEENIPMPLNNIFFAVGDSTLMTSSVAELTRVAELINKIGLKVEISGHTDNTGDFAKNQELSKARANSVYNFLIGKGCNAEKLTSIGYGQTRPVASNKTSEGRQQNRRVEIRFLKD